MSVHDDFDDYYPFALGYVKKRLCTDIFRKEYDEIKQIVAVTVLECLKRKKDVSTGQFALYCGMRAFGTVWDTYYKRKTRRLFKEWIDDLDEPAYESPHENRIEQADLAEYMIKYLSPQKQSAIKDAVCSFDDRDVVASRYKMTKQQFNKLVFESLKEVRERHGIPWRSRIAISREWPVRHRNPVTVRWH